MEEKPGIIMQCPKCSREFSPDVCYCDACSAMLEPVEILSQQVGSGEDLPNSSGTTITKGKDKILQNKILDDVKIDSLKTDMEQRFVRTLLLELEQLKKRFISGDNQLSGNEDAHFHPGDGEGNRANEIIEKRITKLEAILCNLEKKIEADISDMETRLDSLGKPGLLAFLKADGRLSRMLNSELKIKYAVLNSIRSKQLPPPLERLFRPFTVTIIATVILAAVSWTVFSVSVKEQPVPVIPPAASSKFADAREVISGKDVINLLEDIKKANLNKDLSLWESRYSKSYPSLKEKKKSIRKLWQNFDYTSLAYRIDGINIQPATANAQITWYVELRAKKSGKIIRSSEPLSADFTKEDNTLRILEIRKKGW